MEPTISEKYTEKYPEKAAKGITLEESIKGMKDVDVQAVLLFLVDEVNHMNKELSSLKGVK